MQGNTLQSVAEIIESKAIPTLPAWVNRVSREIEDPGVSTARIAALISQEMGLATRVLQLANSPIYRRSERETVSIGAAVGQIGFSEIRNICLAVGVSQQFHGLSNHIDLTNLWRHSLGVAFATCAVARYCDRAIRAKVPIDVLYTAGLLHDIGMVIIDHAVPDAYGRVRKEHQLTGGDLWEVERKVLGTDHADVSALALREWGLSPQLEEIVRHHHGYEKASTDDRPYVAILHVADTICNQHGYCDDFEGTTKPFSESAWHDLGLSDDDIAEIVDETQARIREAELFSALCG